MSLKAKIEAVIYASEEPVTLAQLAGLLGNEAQTELDRQDSAQAALPLDESSEALESSSGTELVAAEATALAEHPDLSTATPDPQPTSADDKALSRQEKERARRLRDFFRTLLDQLIADYAHSSDRGLEIREVAGGFRLATKPEYHDAVRGFVKSLKPPLKLSLPALETLAVVAYKQPVTAPEISEIRGVDSGGVLGSLIARKLITTAGRKQVIGRPILYKTTRDFLLRFGLKDVGELPSIEEFEKMAGELIDPDPVNHLLQEEIPMPHHAPDSPGQLEAESQASEPQADGDTTSLDNSSPAAEAGLHTPPHPHEADSMHTPENTDPEQDSPAADQDIQGSVENPGSEPLRVVVRDVPMHPPSSNTRD